MRLDPNRTSNDIDVTYIARAGEHALALRALERAVGHDLGDLFPSRSSASGRRRRIAPGA